MEVRTLYNNKLVLGVIFGELENSIIISNSNSFSDNSASSGGNNFIY